MRDEYREVCKIIDYNKIETINGVVKDYTDYPIESELDSIFDFYMETLRLQKNDYGIDPAIFYYENSTSVNAVASKQKDFFVVGVNLGTIVYLQKIFKENENLLKIEGIEDYLEFEKSLDTSIQVLMYQQAKHFTFYHEMGHLIQKSDYLNSLVHENLVASEKFDCKRHLCELDADSFSSLCVGSHVFQYAKGQFGNKLTQDQVEKLTVIICSSALFYVLSFQGESLPMYYEEKSHPHPSIRITHIILTIINYILQAFQNEGYEFKLTSKYIINRCISFSNKISEKIEKDGLINSYTELIYKESDGILTYIMKAKKYLDSDASFATNKWNQVAEKLSKQ